jgi:heterodisulfide reductase subunit A-like polyferredoxin/coenzyme F420-reducing hydrogenase delta subunit
MMTDLEMKTLIIGSGPSAVNIAREILGYGNKVILALKEKEASALVRELNPEGMGPARIMTDTKILSCRGCAGDFTVFMERGGKNVSEKISGVVIAEEYEKKPNYSDYGLKPSPDVLSLSYFTGNGIDAKDALKALPEGSKIVFLTGLGYESNPVTAEEIMLASLKLQKDFNLQTYILTGNLKVAGNGLEKLYRETRTAGTVYFKFTNTSPRILQDNEGKVSIELSDEITRLNFRITPAVTVVDETISPSGYLKELAAVFGLQTGRDGFLQSGNLHRTGIYTNRKGIFVAGPSRSFLNNADNVTDFANAAILTSGISDNYKEVKTKAEIKSGSCIKCLTCYRCCPHRAIDIDIRPYVMPDACEGCGICFAECPRGAISLNFPDNRNVADEIRKAADNGKLYPHIIAFCCNRSAARAKELALCMGYRLPANLQIVVVPCSGYVSVEYILSAFKNKADGVLVLTCHPGNSHSEYGNIFARRRVEHLRETFSQMNFEKERLEIKTLASNMGYEFAQIVYKFENTLKALGSGDIKND